MAPRQQLTSFCKSLGVRTWSCWKRRRDGTTTFPSLQPPGESISSTAGKANPGSSIVRASIPTRRGPWSAPPSVRSRPRLPPTKPPPLSLPARLTPPARRRLRRRRYQSRERTTTKRELGVNCSRLRATCRRLIRLQRARSSLRKIRPQRPFGLDAALGTRPSGGSLFVRGGREQRVIQVDDPPRLPGH